MVHLLEEKTPYQNTRILRTNPKVEKAKALDLGVFPFVKVLVY